MLDGDWKLLTRGQKVYFGFLGLIFAVTGVLFAWTLILVMFGEPR